MKMTKNKYLLEYIYEENISLKNKFEWKSVICIAEVSIKNVGGILEPPDFIYFYIKQVCTEHTYISGS